jgi:hypothetical protein
MVAYLNVITKNFLEKLSVRKTTNMTLNRKAGVRGLDFTIKKYEC